MRERQFITAITNDHLSELVLQTFHISCNYKHKIKMTCFSNKHKKKTTPSHEKSNETVVAISTPPFYRRPRDVLRVSR